MKKDYISPFSEVILLEPHAALMQASLENYGIDDDPLFNS